jgi:hypothetical protein
MKDAVKWVEIKNIAICVLAAFVCWYLKSAWGLLALLFMGSVEMKSGDN